ncbi:hypothetical protein KR026_010527 [Drosophila bipectinata]|nr:hypothetical protein KR026_010527 [Drosophila bipectinata]
MGKNRASTGRIQNELANFMRDPPDGCRVDVVNDNIFHWRATIMGPPETPYEGGQFVLNIIFPMQYPFQAPHVTFSSRIYHCNITNSGHICLDILNKEWSPALTIDKVLISIISLLADPNPDDPSDHATAHLYKHDRKQHDFNAQLWTNRYARPRAEDDN